MIRKDDTVRLLRQSDSHVTGRRPVAVNTEGTVLATRFDNGQLMLLVKFNGHTIPRHTPSTDVTK